MAVASLPLLPNMLVSAPSSLSPVSWAMLLVCSSITLIAVWATVTAVSLLPRPTLLAMLRSTEIPLSLVTEAFYWGALPGPVSVLGSIIVSHIMMKIIQLESDVQVTLCVAAMSAHDAMIKIISSLRSRSNSPGVKSEDALNKLDVTITS